ncbi:TPA: type II toxin-antitoxin system RelE/ParE family toxin [Salmonella enterica subsp. enterica serovar Aberdeen]
MYKLSQLADEDIFKIACYTIQQFGKHQAKRYHNELENAFRLLAESPLIGIECEWICSGMRRFEFRRHSVYYMMRDDDILISRIIHQSMDIDRLEFPE